MERFENELKIKWDNISTPDGSLKLAIDHPLEWYVRFDGISRKSVVIISANSVENLYSSKSIEAACNVREDKRYAITFTLTNIEHEDVFITMSNDLIECSINGKGEKEALSKVVRRYNEWIKLLEHKRNARLSLAEQKGLIAELLYLYKRIGMGELPSIAVEGWIGPDGADQDFFYSDGWHEIKATGASSIQVSISSIEQLDVNTKGELLVYRIDKSTPTNKSAVSLYSVVHNVMDVLESQKTIDLFFLKLASAGYIDVEEYKKDCFVVSSNKTYDVNDSFPRIRRADISDEITNCQYQLDLACLAPWEKKE